MFLFMGILCERVCVMRRALAWEEGGGEGGERRREREGIGCGGGSGYMYVFFLCLTGLGLVALVRVVFVMGHKA